MSRYVVPSIRIMLQSECCAAVQEENPRAKSEYAWMYVGSKASKPGGIFRARMNLTTGELSPLEVATTATSGGFMVLDAGKKRMYVVGAAAGPDGKNRDTVS